MIFFRIAVTVTTVMASASAWSAHYPQFFHAFHPTPLPFRSFFQDPAMLQTRFNVYQPQFQRPLQLHYQHQQPPQPTVRLLPLPSPSPPPLPHRMATTDVHHHHHVIHYYYIPSPSGDTRTTGKSYDGSVPPEVRAVQSCEEHQPSSGFVPTYLPPPSPTPLPTTTTTPPPPPPSLVPPTQVPCSGDKDDDDDTVVVDNVNYFPFGRMPVVVAAGAGPTDRQKNVKNDLVYERRDASGPANKLNFILANYLLPPDK